MLAGALPFSSVTRIILTSPLTQRVMPPWHAPEAGPSLQATLSEIKEIKPFGFLISRLPAEELFPRAACPRTPSSTAAL